MARWYQKQVTSTINFTRNISDSFSISKFIINNKQTIYCIYLLFSFICLDSRRRHSCMPTSMDGCSRAHISDAERIHIVVRNNQK